MQAAKYKRKDHPGKLHSTRRNVFKTSGNSSSYSSQSAGPVRVERTTTSPNGNGFTSTPYGKIMASYVGDHNYFALRDRGSWYHTTKQIGSNSSVFASYMLQNDIFQVNKSLGWGTIPSFYLDRANNKLLDRLDNQSISLGTTIGELGSTVSYLSKKVKTIARFGIAIKRGRFSQALSGLGLSRSRFNTFSALSIREAGGNTARAVAARWTEFSFAIVPTINDVKNVAQLYSDPLEVLKKIKLRVTGHSTYSETVYTVRKNKRSASRSEKTQVRHTYNAQIRSTVTYSVGQPEVIAQKALGVYNKSSVVWELVPFSWMIDYAVGVGDFIARLTATDGLTFVSGSNSVSATVLCNAKRQIKTWTSSTRSKSEITQTGKGHMKGYWRVPVWSFPKAKIEFNLPDLSLRQASLAGSVLLLLSTIGKN